MPRKTKKADAALAAEQAIAVHDTFQNAVSRQGLGMPNHTSATSYPLTRISMDYSLLTSLYRNNWIVRRIIDTIPKDMTKNWLEYPCDLKPEQLDLIKRIEKKKRIKKLLQRGLSWGRLYGGAAGIIMIENQEDELDTPLEIDSIMPGDFQGIILVDRWNGISPGQKYVQDVSDPDFGLPEIYRFNYGNPGQSQGFDVHHSRVIRFTGDELPKIEQATASYWGASKIEAVYEELVKRDNSSWNIVGQMFLANLRVLNLNGLDQVAAASSTLAQQRLMSSVQSMNQLMNNFSLQVLGKDEKLTNVPASLAGQAEILQVFMEDICGATGIPFAKLFGRTPGGLASTGEGDENNYVELVSQDREDVLDPAMDKLGPILCQSALGFVADDFTHQWNPIATPSEQKVGDKIKSRTEAIFGAVNNGLISAKTALQELKTLSDDTGIFTNITDEDINKADEEVVNPMLLSMEQEEEGNSDPEQ